MQSIPLFKIYSDERDVEKEHGAARDVCDRLCLDGMDHEDNRRDEGCDRYFFFRIVFKLFLSPGFIGGSVI